MKCSLLSLSSYLDDELEAGKRGELEAHLVGCQRCSSGLGHLEEEIQRINGLAPIHVEESSARSLMEQLGLIMEGDPLPPRSSPRAAAPASPSLPWLNGEAGKALPWRANRSILLDAARSVPAPRPAGDPTVAAASPSPARAPVNTTPMQAAAPVPVARASEEPVVPEGPAGPPRAERVSEPDPSAGAKSIPMPGEPAIESVAEAPMRSAWSQPEPEPERDLKLGEEAAPSIELPGISIQPRRADPAPAPRASAPTSPSLAEPSVASAPSLPALPAPLVTPAPAAPAPALSEPSGELGSTAAVAPLAEPLVTPTPAAPVPGLSEPSVSPTPAAPALAPSELSLSPNPVAPARAKPAEPGAAFPQVEIPAATVSEPHRDAWAPSPLRPGSEGAWSPLPAPELGFEPLPAATPRAAQDPPVARPFQAPTPSGAGDPNAWLRSNPAMPAEAVPWQVTTPPPPRPGPVARLRERWAVQRALSRSEADAAADAQAVAELEATPEPRYETQAGPRAWHRSARELDVPEGLRSGDDAPAPWTGPGGTFGSARTQRSVPGRHSRPLLARRGEVAIASEGEGLDRIRERVNTWVHNRALMAFVGSLLLLVIIAVSVGRAGAPTKSGIPAVGSATSQQPDAGSPATGQPAPGQPDANPGAPANAAPGAAVALNDAHTLGSGSPGAQVKEIRYGNHPGSFYRIVLDIVTSAPGTPTATVGFKDPTTMWVLLDGALPGAAVSGPPDSIVVKSVTQVDPSPSGKIAYEFKLAHPVTVSSQYLPAPMRLVLDLR